MRPKSLTHFLSPEFELEIRSGVLDAMTKYLTQKIDQLNADGYEFETGEGQSDNLELPVELEAVCEEPEGRLKICFDTVVSIALLKRDREEA